MTGYLLRAELHQRRSCQQRHPALSDHPRPFQAALDQAKATLDQAKGNLQRAQAALGKTEIDVARYTPLAKEQAISQQELDDFSITADHLLMSAFTRAVISSGVLQRMAMPISADRD